MNCVYYDLFWTYFTHFPRIPGDRKCLIFLPISVQNPKELIKTCLNNPDSSIFSDRFEIHSKKVGYFKYHNISQNFCSFHQNWMKYVYYDLFWTYFTHFPRIPGNRKCLIFLPISTQNPKELIKTYSNIPEWTTFSDRIEIHSKKFDIWRDFEHILKLKIMKVIYSHNNVNVIVIHN